MRSLCICLWKQNDSLLHVHTRLRLKQEMHSTTIHGLHQSQQGPPSSRLAKLHLSGVTHMGGVNGSLLLELVRKEKSSLGTVERSFLQLCLPLGLLFVLPIQDLDYNML